MWFNKFSCTQERERENDEDMVGVGELAERDREGEGELNSVKLEMILLSWHLIGTLVILQYAT